MTGEELRRRVDDHIRPELEGANDVRRRDGVVDDERDAVSTCDLRDGGDIDEVVLRVRDRLDEDRLRSGRDGPIPLGAVVGVPHVVDADAEARERAVEEDACAAVDARGGDETLAASCETKQQACDRGLARADDDRAGATLQGRESTLGDVMRRVRVARVELPLIGAREPRLRLGEVIEQVRRAQVDRRDARTMRRVGGLACVHLPGVEAEPAPVVVRTHPLSVGAGARL